MQSCSTVCVIQHLFSSNAPEYKWPHKLYKLLEATLLQGQEQGNHLVSFPDPLGVLKGVGGLGTRLSNHYTAHCISCSNILDIMVTTFPLPVETI